MLLPRVRPSAAGAVRSPVAASASLPRCARRAAPSCAPRHARRGAALVAAAKRAAAPPPPPPPPSSINDGDGEDAVSLEEDDGAGDFKAVVKLHCTTLDPDWVNPWQARALRGRRSGAACGRIGSAAASVRLAYPAPTQRRLAR